MRVRTGINALPSSAHFDDTSGVENRLFRIPIDVRDVNQRANEWESIFSSSDDSAAIRSLVERFRAGNYTAELEKIISKHTIELSRKYPGEERPIMIALARMFGFGRGPADGHTSLFSEGGVLHLERANKLSAEIEDGQRRLALVNGLADRAGLMNQAADLWERTHKLGLTDKGALDEGARLVAQWRDEDVLLTDLDGFSDKDAEVARNRMAIHYAFLARWADQAFPILQTSHTYAAALACTDVHPEAVEDMQAPWRALRLEMPVGLVSLFGSIYECEAGAGNGDMKHAHEVHHIDLFVTDIGPVSMAGYSSKGFRLFYLEAATLPMLLATPAGDADALSVRERAADACRRIVAGLLIAMRSSESNYRQRQVEGKRSTPRERGEPGHRRVIVGAPVSVDARPALARFLAGESMSKARKTSGVGSLQWFVRGYFRAQVHGKGRSLRKTIWIEPHWAGRADAEISVRPKVIG